MNTTEEKFGKFFSWDLIDDDTAIKRTDKSVFEFRGSSIPVETSGFWKVVTFNMERINVTLLFEKKEYPAYIKRDNRYRLRIFWFSDFAKKLTTVCNYSPGEDVFPSLMFKRKGKNIYSVEVLDGKVIELDSLSTSDFVSKFEGGLEGGRRVISSVRVERSSKNRKECIAYHGTICAACGFNFEKTYGKLGRGIIEVHHIVPLSTFLKKKKVDPIKDLTPVCSNCHTMIHLKKDKILLIDDLKNILASNYVP